MIRETFFYHYYLLPPDTPAGTSEKDVVATQPPRSSTSLPSLKLAKSPVSTQPRTASLEEQRGVQVGNEVRRNVEEV